MKRTALHRIMALVAGLALCATSAYAEVTVSVTITGNVDEILPIVQHLKDMGVGVGKNVPVPGNTIKMEVHSVAPGPTPAPAPAAPAAPAKPELSLGAPALTPPSVKAGAKAKITVPSVDPDHKIDSVSAMMVIPNSNKVIADLFDNGTHGDAKARDGVWTGAIDVPATVAPGEYLLKVIAFNANGDALLIARKDGTAAPLSSQTKITVTK